MIKLTLPPKPNELTAEKESELVQQYKDNQTAVWRIDFIRNPLLKMTEHKCAYCERKPKEGGGYPTIDHIVPKDIAPDKVVAWDNLIPACTSCNSNKSTLDTSIKPILNPINDNPVDFLVLIAGGLFPINKNELARLSIEKLKLNALDEARADIQKEIAISLNRILKCLESYYVAPDTAPFNDTQLRSQFYELLISCSPEYAYTATKATALFNNDSDYYHIKTIFNNHNIWTPDLTEWELILKPFALLGNSYKR